MGLLMQAKICSFQNSLSMPIAQGYAAEPCSEIDKQNLLGVARTLGIGLYTLKGK